MTSSSLTELLADLLSEYNDDAHHNYRIRSYEEAGVLTTDEGFIVYCYDGEFQVTVIRSK